MPYWALRMAASGSFRQGCETGPGPDPLFSKLHVFREIYMGFFFLEIFIQVPNKIFKKVINNLRFIT
jgi:hypothetical protein